MIARPKGWMVVSWTASIVLALLFLWAAVPKIINHTEFAESVANYRMLPLSVVGLVAAMLPFIEVCAALALLSPTHRRGGALVIMGMLGVFIIGMGQALWRGIDIDCGCFGGSVGVRVSGWSIARNVGLIGIGLLILFAEQRIFFRSVDTESKQL